MRLPNYMSPTSLKKFEESKANDGGVEFYLQYLADNRPDRFPQTQPMSIGSSFDAHCKAYLHNALVGDKNPKFDLKTLFEAQVEPHNRDWAWPHGAYAFKKYKDCGALVDLMMEMSGSIGVPSFEFDVRGVAEGYREGVTISDLKVPIFGKPDIRFINKEGAHVIYDWKVNGYCSKYPVSPKPGYVKCRGGRTAVHKDAVIQLVKGVMINVATRLELVDAEWAAQLATYGWLMGEPVGSEFIVGIDQLACSPLGEVPEIRVASHRCTISEDYQFNLLARYQAAWECITSGHFFTDLSIEESHAKCTALDANNLSVKEGMSEEEKFAIKIARGQ